MKLPLMFPNNRIEALEKERLLGVMNAERLVKKYGDPGEWEKMHQDFVDLTVRRFLKDYCNEQIRRYNKYNILHELLRKPA